MAALSRGTKIVIEEAMNNLPQEKKVNCYCICEEISNILIKRYAHYSDEIEYDIDIMDFSMLEYQSKRMGLSTTLEIMDKIDAYMIYLQKKEIIRKRKELKRIIKEKQQELYELSFK